MDGALRDLRNRLDAAATQLERLSDASPDRYEVDRLRAKASGVALALSYVEEYLR